jgi:leucine dehydrogenase
MGSLTITDVKTQGYERVVKAVDQQSGLRAFISIHDTTLGPALGGLRMLPYRDDAEALTDVNRLARGMTFKSAIAHTACGGGKAVILGDAKRDKSEALYLAMGRFIDSLGGRYITAEDMNTSIADLEIIRRATRWVTGLEPKDGGSGNPSPYTAYGVFLGIRAALAWATGHDGVQGRRIAIQGVGAVGGALARRLREAGAEVYASDINHETLARLQREIGIQPIQEPEIFTLDCDVFAPCARGAILDDATIPSLRCRIVAGAANNQLQEPRHGRALMERGILYAPDYVINAGGIINVSSELLPGGYQEPQSKKRIERIPQALRELWTISQERRIPASEAADQLADRILAEGRKRR